MADPADGGEDLTMPMGWMVPVKSEHLIGHLFVEAATRAEAIEIVRTALVDTRIVVDETRQRSVMTKFLHALCDDRWEPWRVALQGQHGPRKPLRMKKRPSRLRAGSR